MSRVARLVSGVHVAVGLACCATRSAAAEPPQDTPAKRWEPSILPELNYDSNIGFGFGAIGTLARFEPGFDTYRFRLQAQAFLSVAVDEAGNASLPYHDHFIRGDFPGLLGDRLRLFLEIGFAKFADSPYYGLGQLAERQTFSDAELEQSELARRFYTYDRIAPHSDVVGYVTLESIRRPARDARLELIVGVGGAYEGITPYPGGKLAGDIASRGAPTEGGADLERLLHGTSNHGLGTLATGLRWDTRDHEFVPTRGSVTELSTRAGVFGDGAQSSAFVRFHLATRWFVPLWKDALVFAHRAAFDWLVGNPPFYELSQFGVTQVEQGPGGSGSVRGLLLRRFNGKVKVIGNAELRAQGPWFKILGERFRMGAVLFADAGRVWSDVPASAALDGPWAPFAIGIGSGLRLRWADTVVIRADFGVSPPEHTSGFSIDLGHVF